MLPQSTNQDYVGPLWAAYALLLAAAQSLLGGALQVILPDSGLISIAGLNLAHEGGLQMIALAARLGATQIVWGLVLALVALRYRSLTVPLLLMVVIEKSLILFGRMIKPTGSEQMPPSLYGAMGVLVICLIALIVAARSGRAKS